MNGTSLPPFARRLPAELAVMAAAGLVAALVGPFGTFALPLGTRLLDWLVFAFGGFAFFRPVVAGADALWRQGGVPRWAALAVAILLAALPTTLLVAWALTGMAWRELRLAELIALYPQVVLLGGVVTAIQVALRSRAAPPVASEDPLAAPPPPSEPPVPTLLDRLPPHLGRDLLYLGNEDHYVRVYTRAGDTLLLLRMRDAVADLAPIDGMRVHRSWWVARAAVAAPVRRDRALSLRLVDGREIPVARAMVPELRARGWLA
jgi:hypothetical protein